MYTEIGSFDAKTQLSRLLQEVQQGRRFTITLRGRPVADLVPNQGAAGVGAREAIEAMRGIRKVKGTTPDQVAEWVAEGRR